MGFEVLILIVYGLALLFIFIYSLIQIQLVFHYLRKGKNKSASSSSYQNENEEYPYVTVQLPIYNEKYVVKRLLNSVAQFDYPKNRLEVQILDDSSDGHVSQRPDLHRNL